MGKVHTIDHPLVQHKLTILRDKHTGSKEFRELTNEISTLIAYEALRDLELVDVEIESPLGKVNAKKLSGRKLAIVPILRAGIGMVDGFLNLVPAAKVGHVGLYRDPSTHKPVEYYCKLPTDLKERDIFVVDPMLATGGSAIEAVSFVKKQGAEKIRFACIVTCPEGVEALQKAHPDVDIFTASIDNGLNENLYIEPGLGDAGDRLFGTK